MFDTGFVGCDRLLALVSCLIVVADRNGLIQLCLLGLGVQSREEVTGLYRLAFGEVDLGDPALDPASNDGGLAGDRFTYALQIDRNFADCRRRRDHGHWGLVCRCRL